MTELKAWRVRTGWSGSEASPTKYIVLAHDAGAAIRHVEARESQENSYDRRDVLSVEQIEEDAVVLEPLP